MKNSNSPLKKAQRALAARWSEADYPGGTPVFKLARLGKDAAIFFLLPLLSVIVFHACEKAGTPQKRPPGDSKKHSAAMRFDVSKSQIITFQGGGKSGPSVAGVIKRAPGVLVRVKLMNVVATYSTAPVHAQIVDAALGKQFMGGSLIGDATPDSNFQRINIAFRFARDPVHENFAVPITARALSPDGTLGLDAQKKEGFFTRSVYGSAGQTTQGLETKGGQTDFRDILLRALSAGFIQEFGSGTQIEKNRSQVLTLDPAIEFFAELTDYFPGGGAK